jgi:hypothetical protein
MQQGIDLGYAGPVRIEYPRDDALSTAWAAIDRGEPVEMVIRSPWRVRLARKALPLCRFFFESSERPWRTLPNLLAFAVYGWPLAPLLAVYNHAVLTGMRPAWTEAEGEAEGGIIVSFAPAAARGPEPRAESAR